MAVGPSLRAVAKQNDRRLALVACSQERAEVGVGGNHNALLMLSANEDLLVGGGLHVVIADMRGIVPSFLQPRGENR